LTFAWYNHLPNWMPKELENNYEVQVRKVTTKPATHHAAWHSGRENLTFDYMHDFAFAPADEPKEALARHCHQVTPQVFQVQEGSTENVIPALSMDISFSVSQVERAIQMIDNLAWTRNVSFYARYTDKDTYDMPLSPYFDGGRVGIDISLNPPTWGGKPKNIGAGDPDVVAFKADIVLLLGQVVAAGLQPRYHIGKSGFMDFPFWDQQRLAKFEASAQEEDPQDLFTNQYLELLKVQNR